MDKFLKIVAGLLLGALLGAALVVLFAPQSGEETRRQIRERIEAVLEEGQKAAEERRLQLMAQFEELKQPQPRT